MAAKGKVAQYWKGAVAQRSTVMHTADMTPELHEYVAAVHIHSVYSDGLHPIPEIAATAEQCGIDILLFADHMTLRPLADGMQRWFGPVLSVIGYEINDTDNRNHYLAYGLNDTLPAGLDACGYVRQTREAGGIGFIAHPDEKRTAFREIPPYPWTAWDAEGFDGIEIWNHSSEWLERLTNLNKYYYVMHPLKYLLGPEPETLARWDDLNRTRRVAGIGGLDAHAFPYRIGPVTLYIFRYKVLFRGVKTHILVGDRLPAGDGDAAARIVLETLAAARCFIANHRWGDARGFRFHAEADGRTWQMGDTVPADAGAVFRVRTPLPGRISLIRDGKIHAVAKGTELTAEASQDGAWRVEVIRRGRQWIYSNHIRVKGATDG